MTTSRPKSQCRESGPYAPSGTSSSLVASWLTPSNLICLFSHDLIRKPVPTFRDHAVTQSSCVAARTRAVAFGHLLVLGHRIVLEDFALEDPDLDAAGTERGESGRNAVVDVCAQRGQRHAAF